MSLKRSVTIIGVGNVGSTTAFSLATQGLCDELILIDIKEKKSEGDGLDLEDAMAYLPVHITIKVNDYDAASESDLVIISAGSLPTIDQTRLDTLDEAKGIIDEVVPKLIAKGFKGIFLNITNPCDVVTYYIWKKSGFPSHRVLGTGTGLDSARLKKILGKLLDIAPSSIEGYAMGEHGDSQMVPWSHIHARGKPFLKIIKEDSKYKDLDLHDLTHQVAYGGWEVLLRKGATYYGIGTVAADIVRAIFNNENRIMPISTLLKGEYGQEDVYIGVPTIINSSGVREVIEIELTSKEQKLFNKSAKIIKGYNAKLV